MHGRGRHIFLSLSLSLLYYSTLFEACLCAAELYVYVCVLRLLHF